jgi:hypothetical protein
MTGKLSERSLGRNGDRSREIFLRADILRNRADSTIGQSDIQGALRQLHPTPGGLPLKAIGCFAALGAT